MFVSNGKCYAENPLPVFKITSAENCGDYKLKVVFNGKEARMFDGRTLLVGEAFLPLNDEAIFANYKLDYETLTWLDGDLDVAPEFVYANSEAVE